MKKLTQAEYDAALVLHEKWLNDEKGGVRMTFVKFDFSDIDFGESADLSGAYLTRANLSGANLTRADLTGADDERYTLIGERPFITIGPIGSREDYLLAFITDQGLRLHTGCFCYGTVEQFRANLARDHGNNVHGQEYAAALDLAIKHAELWTPKAEETPVETPAE